MSLPAFTALRTRGFSKATLSKSTPSSFDTVSFDFSPVPGGKSATNAAYGDAATLAAPQKRSSAKKISSIVDTPVRSVIKDECVWSRNSTEDLGNSLINISSSIGHWGGVI
ncbi:MAG: hypothetical protein LQ346_002668 [Caloplaca aetnensis]|nr:MAG: hypothetical protein LQ346_002668 [Caloplaca aetnensis]